VLHYSLCKNKAFLGVVTKCPWSPFWWFTAWNIHVCQSSSTWDHMTISETVATHTWPIIFLVWCKNVDKKWRNETSLMFSNLFLWNEAVLWMLFFVSAWNIHVCQSSSTWDHMTATFKNACWASIIFCMHLT
jgi:hypothetical protein